MHCSIRVNCLHFYMKFKMLIILNWLCIFIVYFTFRSNSYSLWFKWDLSIKFYNKIGSDTTFLMHFLKMINIMIYYTEIVKCLTNHGCHSLFLAMSFVQIINHWVAFFCFMKHLVFSELCKILHNPLQFNHQLYLFYEIKRAKVHSMCIQVTASVWCLFYGHFRHSAY